MNNAVFLFGLSCVLLIPGAESDPIGCPRQVTGAEYGKVSFKCEYSGDPPANKRSRKFCCLQGTRPGSCKHTVISTSGYTADRFANRIELVDTWEGPFFTVTINGLEKGDEGTYICGIGLADTRIKNLVTLSVVEDSVIIRDAKLIYTQLWGTVIFKCHYDEPAPALRRYLCKVTKSGCVNVIDSKGRTGSSYDGRVTADSREAGMFVVKMVQVRNSDVGHYTCSSDNPEESTDPPTYDVRINEKTDIPQGPRLLTPRLGGSLCAQCDYNPAKNYTKKFWCKLQDGACDPIVTKDGDVKDAYEGKVIIHDNATSGSMQVLMDNISQEDEGWYWCVMTNENEKHDQTSAVQVRISDENLPGLSGSRIVRAVAGDPVKLTCSYPCRFKSAEKYWCLWSNHGCKPMSNVEDTQDPQLVTCKTEELALNIESVSQKDSGFYWCGVRHDGRYGEIIAVRLIVEEAPRDVVNTNERPDVVNTNERPDVVNTNERPDVVNTKERANNVEDSEKVAVVNSDTPPSTDSNKSGTVTAAVVSVCVAVLVVCAVFLFLRFKKRKNSDLVSVGSYRTNISMSDLDNNVGKENPVTTDLQETDISRSGDSPKSKKKGSRENLDYSCFLINHVGAPNEQVAE